MQSVCPTCSTAMRRKMWFDVGNGRQKEDIICMFIDVLYSFSMR